MWEPRSYMGSSRGAVSVVDLKYGTVLSSSLAGIGLFFLKFCERAFFTSLSVLAWDEFSIALLPIVYRRIIVELPCKIIIESSSSIAGLPPGIRF